MQSFVTFYQVVTEEKTFEKQVQQTHSDGNSSHGQKNFKVGTKKFGSVGFTETQMTKKILM